MLPGFPRILTLLFFGSTSLAQAQPFFSPGQDPKPAGKVWAKVEVMSDEFSTPMQFTERTDSIPRRSSCRLD